MTNDAPRRTTLTPAQLVSVVVGVLAAVAAVAALLVVLPPAVRASAPELPVRDYLQALVDGDASAALRDARITPGPSDVLLTDAAYRGAGDRLTGFSVLRTRVDGDTAAVRVQLRQGTTSYPVEFDVTRPSGIPGLTPWRLRKQTLPRATVEVHGPGDLPVTVGGAQATPHAGRVVLSALPGSYRVAASGGRYYAAAGTTVTTSFAGGQDPAVLTASLRPAGVAVIQSAIDAWLTQCAASAELHPAGCPFLAIPTPGVVYSDGRWSIQTRPRITEGDWSDRLGGWPVGTTGPGYATFDADAAQNGLSGTATTGSQPFSVAGTAVGDPSSGVRFVPAPSYSSDSPAGPAA